MPHQVYQLVQSKLQHITEMQLRKRNTKHGIFFKKNKQKKRKGEIWLHKPPTCIYRWITVIKQDSIIRAKLIEIILQKRRRPNY